MVREHLLTVCQVWSLLTSLDCESSGPSMLVPGTALPQLGPKPASLTICLSLVKFLGEREKRRKKPPSNVLSGRSKKLTQEHLLIP